MRILTFVVVQVGFTQSAFPVSETDGSVSVCTAISGVVLDRNVTVLLSTQDNTATCKFVCFCVQSDILFNEPACTVCGLTFGKMCIVPDEIIHAYKFIFGYFIFINSGLNKYVCIRRTYMGNFYYWCSTQATIYSKCIRQAEICSQQSNQSQIGETLLLLNVLQVKVRIITGLVNQLISTCKGGYILLQQISCEDICLARSGWSDTFKSSTKFVLDGGKIENSCTNLVTMYCHMVLTHNLT